MTTTGPDEDRAGGGPESIFEVIVDTCLDAVITMDGSGMVTGWNQRAERLFGWTRDQALGERLSTLIIPLRYRGRHDQGLSHYNANGQGPVLGQILQLEGLRRDGSEFAAEVAIAPPWHDGDRTTFIGFVRDVTDRRSAEEHTQRRLVEMTELQQAKDDFLRMASHRLRTPLTVLLGYLSLMADGSYGPLDEELRQIVAVLEDKVTEMNVTVQSFLESPRPPGEARALLAAVEQAQEGGAVG